MKNLFKTLKIVKNKYEQRYLFKIVKELYDVNIDECITYLNNLTFVMPMEFIWYCPRSSCNSIVLKTNKPLLDLSTEYKCKRCNTIHTSKVLIVHNKRNLKKYIDEIEKQIN